jgi:antimicrobial peptide system SdpA family protein
MTGVAIETQQLQKLGVFVVLLASFVVIFCCYAIHASLPFNTIRLPFETWAHIRFFAPEGFGFFTRNPREERMLLFTKRDNGWVSASVGPNGDVRNLFGLNRAPRAQGFESSLLFSKVPMKVLVGCEETPKVCLSQSSTPIQTTNAYPHATLCGSVGIVVQKPIPWAWSLSETPIIMPSKFVILNVKCK